MRVRLLKWLVCPYCRSDLKLKTYLKNETEIIEGILYCTCEQNFPIIKGVPRFLPFHLNIVLQQLYSEFFIRYPNLKDTERSLSEIKPNKKIGRTIERFGYEWTEFSEYNCDNFTSFIAPLPSYFFKGKFGLDVGCGAGRHAYNASKEGSEIIGIDISQAVDAAFEKNKKNKLVHIIQADIYNLPFRPETFQFIYSLGVLHHLPKPELGYKSLIPLLKKDGSIFVWLYAYTLRKKALETLRVISQRLSNKNIKRMAYLCNLIDYGLFINLYRITKNLPFFGEFIDHHSPSRIKEYAEYGFQTNYTDWFDRLSAPITNYYKRNEIEKWLSDDNLCNTQLQAVDDSWWWLYGERKKI